MVAYRINIDAAELEFDGPPRELRDRLLWTLQAEGVAASLWQLRPLPAQPLFRHGGRFRSWQPGEDESLDPWDPREFPVAARLLESSMVIGTADQPLFNQPPELMARYIDAFHRVLGDPATLFSAAYRPVELV